MNARILRVYAFGLGCFAALAAAATAASLPARAVQAAAAPLSSQAEPTAQRDAAAAAETRTYLKRLEKLGFAGVVLVARGETPLFVDGFGLADRERGSRWTPGTVSDIGSITKQFTAAAILKLEEGGEAARDEPDQPLLSRRPRRQGRDHASQPPVALVGPHRPRYRRLRARPARRVLAPGLRHAPSVRPGGRLLVRERELQPAGGDHREALGRKLRGVCARAPVPPERHVRDGLQAPAVGRFGRGPRRARLPRRSALGHDPRAPDGRRRSALGPPRERRPPRHRLRHVPLGPGPARRARPHAGIHEDALGAAHERGRRHVLRLRLVDRHGP